MLCFVCLVTGHEPPSKADVYVQGTSVCRDHLTGLKQANQQFSGQQPTPEPPPQQGVDLSQIDLSDIPDLDRKLALLQRYMQKRK